MSSGLLLGRCEYFVPFHVVEIQSPDIIGCIHPPVPVDAMDEEEPVIDGVAGDGTKRDVSLWHIGWPDKAGPPQGCRVKPADRASILPVDMDGAVACSVSVAGPYQVDDGAFRCGFDHHLAGSGVDEEGLHGSADVCGEDQSVEVI